MSEPQAINFYDLTVPELTDLFKGLGKEKFRAEQLYRWVYKMRVFDVDAMTNFAKEFRQEIKQMFRFQRPAVVQELISVDGTRKYLFEIEPGQTVETVLIPNEDRLTLCVSSEVGCNMACKFCFTAKQKLTRRLTRAEIVGQYLGVLERLPEGLRITNIVFMGMGEPLDNPDGVFGAVEILNSQWGLNFSRRKITVSTSGLVPQIPLVEKARVRLAVSLNATTEQTRSLIMPINQKYSMRELLDSCREYAMKSGDKVTFEYVLLKGITDSLEDARRLKEITRRVPCKINIIPFNEHPGSEFKRPDFETVQAFQQECMRIGLHVLLRRTMGRDIYAACGQLRSKYEGHPERIVEDQLKVGAIPPKPSSRKERLLASRV